MHAAEAYDALMLDYAAGALAPARTLLVETHMRLRPSDGAVFTALDAMGGALLEGLEPEDISSLPLTGIAAGAEAKGAGAGAGQRPDDRMIEARALIEAASRHPQNLSWRWRAPGLRELRLPLSGASLIWLQGGKALAAHDHTAEEVTLVLRGGYSDKLGAYDVGDIAFADVGIDHSPFVPPGEDCVCMVATDGKLRFQGLLARVVARVLG